MMVGGVSLSATLPSQCVCAYGDAAATHPWRRCRRSTIRPATQTPTRGCRPWDARAAFPAAKRFRCVPCRPTQLFAFKSESGEDIPQEVVDAEEKSAGGRQYRMAAMGVMGGLAAALTLTRVALNVFGVSVSTEFLRPSILGELLDIIVIATAGILWNSELSTKEANIQRIWEEVKRRREQAGPTFVGKDELRKRKKVQKGGRRLAKGFSQEMRELRREEQRRADASGRVEGPPKQEPEGEEEKGRNAGVLGSLKSAYDSANDAGRVQALQINNALEEAGLLKPLASTEDGDTEKGEADTSKDKRKAQEFDDDRRESGS